jgi:ABC-2 type transport system permease protein
VIAMTLLAVERIKLFSTRSPWWCMLLALALTAGLSALIASQSNDQYPLTVGGTQAGYQFGLMVIMVMAALAVTTEYRFGTIRTTFQAVPNRSAALAAKTVLVAAVAGVVGEATAFASWGLAKAIKPSADLALDTAGEWRAVAGVGLVYAAGAVLAVGVGTLVRQTAGAVSIVLVWALLVENLVALIPKVGSDVRKWMPFNAANHFLTSGAPSVGAGTAQSAQMPYGPWGGLAYFAGIAVAVLVLGVVMAERRDA